MPDAGPAVDRRLDVLAQRHVAVDDFLVRIEGRVVHVLNAPSPAATSSLAIGETIVGELRSLSP